MLRIRDWLLAVLLWGSIPVANIFQMIGKIRTERVILRMGEQDPGETLALPTDYILEKSPILLPEEFAQRQHLGRRI